MHFCSLYGYVQGTSTIKEAITYPCTAFDAEDGKLLYTTSVAVLVDNQPVCQCHDIFSAICALFSRYYVFDINHAPALDNVMLFIGSYVLGIENHKITPAVQRRINWLALP